MSRLPIVKEEYEELTTPLEGWNPLDSEDTATISFQQPTTTTQSVSNQHSLTTSNDSTTATSLTTPQPFDGDNDKTRSSIASVHEIPKDSHHKGLVKKAERNSRPFIVSRNKNNKFTSNGSQVQQQNAEYLNLQLQFIQRREQMKEQTAKFVETENAYQKKYDEVKLKNVEFKNNPNEKFAKLEKENMKLKDEVNQLKELTAKFVETENAYQKKYDEVKLKNVEFKKNPNEKFAKLEKENMKLKDEVNQLKELTAKLAENENANQKKCDELKLKNFDFKKNANAKFEKSEMENAKLKDEVNQLKELTAKLENENACQKLQMEELQDEVNQLNDQLSLISQVKSQTPSETSQTTEFDTEQDFDTTQLQQNEDASFLLPQNESIAQTGEILNTNEMNNNQISLQMEEEEERNNINDDEESPRSLKRPRMDSTNGLINQDSDAGEGTSGSTEQAAAQLETIESAQEKIKVISVRCPQSGCTVSVLNRELFNAHMATTHSIGPARCLVRNCSRSCDNITNFIDHLKVAHVLLFQSNVWPCQKCTKFFGTYSALTIHHTEHHQLGQYRCAFPLCTYTAECQAKVSVHYIVSHKHKTLKCEHCVFSTSKQVYLKSHQRAHLGAIAFQCKWPHCDYAAGTRGQALVHIGRKHLNTSSSSSSSNGEILEVPEDYLKVIGPLIHIK